jgi:predicted aminopeptidase
MRIAAMVLALTISGCSALGYYAQAARGQWGVLSAARPIDDWLDDPAVSDELKQRLRLAREIRQFASRELAEPDNSSYTR